MQLDTNVSSANIRIVAFGSGHEENAKRRECAGAFRRGKTNEVTMNGHVQTASAARFSIPLGAGFIRNPYPHYARCDAADPMHLTSFGSFVASRHAEASLVLRDKRFGKDFVERTIRRYGPDIMKGAESSAA